MSSSWESSEPPRIILVPGYWLGAWAWDEVLEHLTAAGAQATAMTLPGLDPEDPHRLGRTLEDQAAAILEAVTSADGEVVLVCHSGANGPVSLVLDRRPDLVSRVVWVDSGPVPDGGAFSPDLPETTRELPLPDFVALGQQASLEGLTGEHLARFRARAVTEPAGIAREPLRLHNAARRMVPTTLICSSVSSEHLLDKARAGHPMFAEVAHLTDVCTIDLPTGHWPMWSRPGELADAIIAASRQPR